MRCKKIVLKTFIFSIIILFSALTKMVFASEYPPALEQDGNTVLGPASASHPLFDRVMESGVPDPSWSKIAGATLGEPSIYQDPSGRIWVYDPETGSFKASTGSINLGEEIYDGQGRLIWKKVPIFDTWWSGEITGWEIWEYTYDGDGLIGYTKKIYGTDLTADAHTLYEYSNLEYYDSGPNNGKLKSYTLTINYRDQAGNYQISATHEFYGLGYYETGHLYEGELSNYKVTLFNASGQPLGSQEYHDLTYITSGINEGKLASSTVDHINPDGTISRTQADEFTYNHEGKLVRKRTAQTYSTWGYITDETYDLTGRVATRNTNWKDSAGNSTGGYDEVFEYNYAEVGYEDARVSYHEYVYKDANGDPTDKSTENNKWNEQGSIKHQDYSYEYPVGKEMYSGDTDYTYYADGKTTKSYESTYMNYEWDNQGSKNVTYIGDYGSTNHENGNWDESTSVSYYVSSYDFANGTGNPEYESTYVAYYENDVYKGYDWTNTHYGEAGNIIDQQSGSQRW